MLDYNSKVVTLDDIVFEHRNRAYGAYWLRKNADDYELRGLLLAAAVFTIALAAPLLGAKVHPSAVDAAARTKPRVLDVYLPPQNLPDLPKTAGGAAAAAKPETVSKSHGQPQIVQEPDNGQTTKPSDFGETTPTEVFGSTEGPDFGNPGIGNGTDPNSSGPGTEIGTSPEVKEPTTFPEVFPRTSYDLAAYLRKNLHYPADAVDAGVSGKVYVQFVIDTDGKVTDVQVLKGLGFGCDEEARRVITSMPDWEPGLQGDRPVPVRYKLAISFSLQ